MQIKTPDFEHPILRLGSVALLTGFVIIIVSTIFHPSTQSLTNHPLVFAEYANSKTWIASHIGQFAGVMLVFVGGFVALHRLLAISESGVAKALALIGLAAAVVAASTFAILQAIDGIALKRAVDSWAAAPANEKVPAFRVAEAIRWIEIGTNSIFRILQGSVTVIFGAAIAISGLLHRWIGGLGILAGATTIIWSRDRLCWFCQSTCSGRCFDIYVIYLAGNFRRIHVEKVYDKDQRLTLEILKEISHSLDDVIELLVNTLTV